MEMLSVKSAVERTLQGYIASFNNIDDLFMETERYIASLFVSRQINRGYLVQVNVDGSLEVHFDVRGHKTALTFKLPAQFKPAPPPAVCVPVDKKDPVVADFIVNVLSTLRSIPVSILNDDELNVELVYRVGLKYPPVYEYTFFLMKVKSKDGWLVQGDVHLQPYKDSCTIVLPITFTV